MTPEQSSPAAKRSAKWILASASLVQFFLFLTVTNSEIADGFSPGGFTRPRVFGSAINGIDSHGYYAWLRSPLIDGDWHFANEFEIFRSQSPESGSTGTTPIGRTANHWSVGPALAWSMAVVPVHLCLTAAGLQGAEPRGYSLPYQLAVASVTLALSLATLLFLYKIARTFVSPVSAAIAAGITMLGTPLITYGTVTLGFAHGPAAAALAAYVWVWLRTFGSTSPRRWFTVGLLLGSACLMRWQLATFVVLPALETVCLLRARWTRPHQPLALAVCGACGAIIAFIPQMVAWSVVYGHPLVNPHPTKPDWFSPSLWQVLGSPDRSLFYWTPVTIIGTVGLLVAAGSRQPEAARSRILLVAAAVQVYLLAALIDRGIWLGYSHGFRFFTETCVVFVVGLAVVIRFVAPRWPTLLVLACGVLVGWNLMLVEVYNRCIPGAEIGPAGLVAAVVRYVIKRPIEAAVLLALAAGFAIRVRWGLSASIAPTEATHRPDRAGIAGRLIRVFRRSHAR